MSQQYPGQQGPGQQGPGEQGPYGGPAAPYGYAPLAPVDPGQGLAIAGFVLAFVFAPVGIVLCAIARKNSQAAGFDNQLARWGLILSIAFTGLAVLAIVLYFVFVIVIFGMLATTATTY